MKNLAMILSIFVGLQSFAQVDRDQLALDISKADAANMEKLKAFIWKKASVVTVEGEVKLNMLNEISISEDDSISITNLDSQTSVKQKRGVRGKIQQSTAQSNSEYMENALHHGLAYIYMTKGQLLDFFDKAEITDKDGVIEATASNVFVNGDKLSVKVDSATKLFIHKEFSSTMGEDPISGKINYKKFTSGIVHVDNSTMNLPAKKAVIKSQNKDYVQKVM